MIKSRESNELSGLSVNNDGALYYKVSTRSRNQQSEPQRIFFVFVNNSLPEDHREEDAARFEAGGGGLEPIICVDKPLDMMLQNIQKGADLRATWLLI